MEKEILKLESSTYLTKMLVLSSFFSTIMNREITEDEPQAEEKSRINGYKNRFPQKTTKESNVIVNNGNLVPDTIKVAQEIIEERKLK